MMQDTPSQPSLLPQSPDSAKSHAKKRSRKFKFWRNVVTTLGVVASLVAILQFAGIASVKDLFYHPTPITPTPTPVKPPPIGTIRYSHATPGWGGLLTWSPNGERIADTAKDGTIQIWDAMTGQHQVTYQGHKGKTVTALAWSPDSTHIASIATDGTLQIWLADSAATTFKYSVASILERAGKQTTNPVATTLAWSPHDNQSLAIGDDKGDVLTVNLGELSLRPYDINVFGGYQEPISALAWAPDGKQLAVGGGLNLDIWNMGSFPPQRIRTLPEGGVMSLAWSPNGKLIAGMLLLAYSTAPGVWNVTKNEQRPQQIAEQELSLAWACDSNRIALGGQNSVTIWDYAAQKALYTFSDVVGATSVAWSPDATLIASGSEDGRILVWQASDRKMC